MNTGQPGETVALPVEIWGAVFQFCIEPLSQPQGYSLFAYETLLDASIQGRVYDYRDQKDTLNVLRCVCRLWMDIVDGLRLGDQLLITCPSTAAWPSLQSSSRLNELVYSPRKPSYFITLRGARAGLSSLTCASSPVREKWLRSPLLLLRVPHCDIPATSHGIFRVMENRRIRGLSWPSEEDNHFRTYGALTHSCFRDLVSLKLDIPPIMMGANQPPALTLPKLRCLLLDNRSGVVEFLDDWYFPDLRILSAHARILRPVGWNETDEDYERPPYSIYKRFLARHAPTIEELKLDLGDFPLLGQQPQILPGLRFYHVRDLDALNSILSTLHHDQQGTIPPILTIPVNLTIVINSPFVCPWGVSRLGASLLEYEEILRPISLELAGTWSLQTDGLDRLLGRARPGEVAGFFKVAVLARLDVRDACGSSLESGAASAFKAYAYKRSQESLI